MENLQNSPRRLFGMQLVGLARRWRRTLDVNLSIAGLSDATWSPLFYMSQAGDGISQRALAAKIGVDDSSLVRLLDILVGQGFVEKRPDATDRRVKRLYVTPVGTAAVEKVCTQLFACEDKMLQDLDDDVISAMLDGFAKVEARIAKMDGMV